MTSETRDRTAADGGTDADWEGDRSPEWKVGIATVDITPDGTAAHALAGFSARDGPMDGVTDDIHAKAVAFEDATGRRLVVLSFELIFVLPSQREWLVDRCEERWGVEPEALLINPTHTHYAPSYRTRPEDLDEGADESTRIEAAYRERIDEAFLSVIDGAIADLEPADLHHSRGRCAIAMSRRRPSEDGFDFKPHADGPVDHDVPVLTVRAGGKLKGILFGYACHPTSVNVYNEVFGDWPGAAMRSLEEAHPDATALFLIGCAGDQKAYPQGSVELARQHGRTMANAVEAALETEQRPVRGPLRVVAEDVTLDMEEPIEDDGTRTGTRVTHRNYPVQAVGFGSDLTLLSLSGEVVAGYANRLKADLAGPLWVSAYANSVGYVPTARVLSEGGYEARQSHAAGRYAASTEERILGGARALAERVGCRRR